jgi:hypothetical protein
MPGWCRTWDALRVGFKTYAAYFARMTGNEARRERSEKVDCINRDWAARAWCIWHAVAARMLAVHAEIRDGRA